MSTISNVLYLLILTCTGLETSISTFAGRTLFTLKYLAKGYTDCPSYKQEKLPYIFDGTMTVTQGSSRLKAALEKYKNINPSSFLLGASTSEHQCSHECKPEFCSAVRFAQQHNLPQPGDPEFGQINLWDNYKSYIDYAKDHLHLNSLRFSIEWALVEKTRGVYDQNVLAHYADQYLYAIQKGITPVVCFHHYTDPCWFIDQSGFEKTANIKLFAQFCTSVYEYITHALLLSAQNKLLTDQAIELIRLRPPLFATFNSPEGYAFKGYYEQVSPPFDKKKIGFSWVSLVLGNMMKAHVAAYNDIKALYMRTISQVPQELKCFIPEPQIGFLKNIHQLDPAVDGGIIHNAIHPLIGGFGDLIQNEGIYQFFTTGKYNVGHVAKSRISIIDKRAPDSLDFIGLNYYSNRHMSYGKTVQEPEELQTDNNRYSIYPSGLYRAIAELSDRLAKPLGARRYPNQRRAIPIFVTENGIATQDEAQRNRFYAQYLEALIQAVQDGYDVRGYLTWTLADNYEWQRIPAKRFDTTNKRRLYGLCTVSEGGATLAKKAGAQFYCNLANEFLYK